MALKTKFAPFLSVRRRVAAAAGRHASAARAPARHAAAASRWTRGPSGALGPGRGARYVPGELFAVGLYGWFEFRNTVYTLSTFASFSKNGIKSKSSESVMSSNHDATGTWNDKQ